MVIKIDILKHSHEKNYDEEEVVDLTSPEDVLIYVRRSWCNKNPQTPWDNYIIDVCTVIFSADNVMGAASYEDAYGGFLDYVIQDLIECPGEGWYVVKGVTATFYRGDGWSTDDDVDYECAGIRNATSDEIKLA